MHRVHVKTLGCKVNTFDSHALENQFRQSGYVVTEQSADADITVINTCSVTHNADREARYLIRRMRRERPEGVLVVTGCYAQTDSARLVAMSEVDFVVPNEAKDRLVTFLRESMAKRLAGDPTTKLPTEVKEVSENRQSHFKSSLTLFDEDAASSRTRAFVKIQDGCNGFCTYCLIPYARGASRSVQPDEALREITRLVEHGSQEIVLTGIHIGDYGRDLPGATPGDDPFLALLAQIFAIPGLARLRISSLEPCELTEGLVKLAAARREIFCDHLHLPLQSGSDAILRKMRRSYTAAQYAEALAMARSYFPEANIGADVIPGFPGETEADFQETVAFIEQVGINYLHVFPYSARPNTAAIRMPGHLPPEVVKERSSILRTLSKKLARKYAEPFVGKTVPVLWEGSLDSQGRRTGLTRNYLTVAAATPEAAHQGTESLVNLRGFVDETRLLGTAVACH